MISLSSPAAGVGWLDGTDEADVDGGSVMTVVAEVPLDSGAVPLRPAGADGAVALFVWTVELLDDAALESSPQALVNVRAMATSALQRDTGRFCPRRSQDRRRVNAERSDVVGYPRARATAHRATAASVNWPLGEPNRRNSS